MAAAVRVNATSYELSGIPHDDLALPAIENDHPLVLVSRPVLRKQAWPPIVIGVDDGHGALPPKANRMARPQIPDRSHRLADDDVVVTMQVNVKPIRACRAIDIAVAEIEAEEIAIGLEALARDATVLERW